MCTARFQPPARRPARLPARLPACHVVSYHPDAYDTNFSYLTPHVRAHTHLQYLLTNMDKLDALVVAAVVAEEAAKISLLRSAWDTVGPTKERLDDRDDPVIEQVSVRKSQGERE